MHKKYKDLKCSEISSGKILKFNFSKSTFLSGEKILFLIFGFIFPSKKNIHPFYVAVALYPVSMPLPPFLSHATLCIQDKYLRKR